MNKIYLTIQQDNTNTIIKVTMQIFMVSKFNIEFCLPCVLRLIFRALSLKL